MMFASSSRNQGNSPNITIQLNSKPINMPPNLRSPVFSRKGGQREKLGDSLKSSGERSLQKSLRFTKILPKQWKNEDSEVHSEVNIIHMLSSRIEDSQQTVIHKVRSKSNSKEAFLQLKKTSPKHKSPGRKVLEDLSGIDPTRKSRLTNKNDDHYIYWKNKAYEYLEANIKLMEEVRKLTRENDDLKTTVAELQQRLKTKIETKDIRIYSEKEFNREMRNISSIYISKIQGMEKELKRKEIIITTYQLKIEELTKKLAGDSDRIRLITRMEEEIEHLKSELWNKKCELQLESRLQASTSILVPENSNG